MRKHSLSQMSIQELNEELKSMTAAIVRLMDTQDPTGKFQLESARALKFAIECQLRHRKQESAPAPMLSNVVSLSEFKARKDQKSAQVSRDHS